MIEVVQPPDTDWFRSADGTYCVRVGPELVTVSRGYAFYKLVADCLKNDDISKAIQYSQFQKVYSVWSAGSPLKYVNNGKILFDGQALPTDFQGKIVARINDGTSAACVTAALIRAIRMIELYEDAGKRIPASNSRREINVRPSVDLSTLLDKDQCDIAYHGWLVFLNQHGRVVIDSNDDTGEMLVKSKKNGRKVLIADCPTGKIVTLPVADTVETCEQAQDWLAGNIAGPGEVPLRLPPVKIVTRY